MIRGEFVTQLSIVSLSNNAVYRRIDDMSTDILDHVSQEVKSAPLPVISIQLNESTDIASCLQFWFPWGILVMVALKVSFFYTHILKWQLLHMLYVTQWDHIWKTIRLLAEGLWCLHGWCSSYADMSIWFQYLVLNEPKVIRIHCMIHL